MNESVSASATKASSDLLRLLAGHARSLARDQVRLQEAVRAKSNDSVIAANLRGQRKLVDELRGKVGGMRLHSRTERQAKPLILASLRSTSRGLTWLEAAYRAAPGDPSHPHSRDARKQDFAESVAQFKRAQASGAKATRKLGLS